MCPAQEPNQSILSRLQDHPGHVVTASLSALLSLPASIEWFGQRVSTAFGVAVGVFVLTFIAASWLAPCVFRSKKKSIQAIVPAQPQLIASPRNPSDAVHGDSPILIPPEESLGQHLYQDAFLAMAQGEITGLARPYLIKAGQEIAAWVDRQYFRICQAYPGIPRQNLKCRYFEMAFREVKAGKLLDSLTAGFVVPTVQDFVATRFAQKY